MDYLQNPFYILNVAPQDNRRRIMEQADARSLFQDPEECRTAATTLTNPRRRLLAEIAWLPCSRLERPEDMRELMNTALFGTSNLTPIARSNLLAAELGRLPDCTSDVLATRLLRIAYSAEEIDTEQVFTVINADRVVSGFPKTNTLDLETEIQNLRDYYRKVMQSAVTKQVEMQRAETMTRAIERATLSTQQMPLLINRLVDSYEVDAQMSLGEQEMKIAALDEKLRAAADADRPDSVLTPLVNRLISAVKHWDAIAQPIQLSKKSRGLSHRGSLDLAWRVRELALYLWNDYGKLDFCKQFINMLREVFAEVSEVVAIIDEDKKSLDDIAMQHAHLTRGVEQFERIKAQVEKLQAAADAKRSDALLNSMVADLTRYVNRWDAAVQPTEANTAVTVLVRGLALHLWNEHGQLDISLQLTKALQRAFADVGEISDRLEEDNKTLSQLVQERARILKTSGQESAGGGYGCLWTMGIFIALGLLGALFENC